MTQPPADRPALRALIVDWGGVLTSPLRDTMSAWAEADGVDHEHFRTVMREWLGTDGEDDGGTVTAPNPAHRLERGELSGPDFERLLAARLRTRDGRAIDAAGLLGRMFAGFRTEDAMADLVRRAHAAGLKTALLSNSWGNTYQREDWPSLFDAAVVSGEVRMRKPDPDIYLHTAGLLGVEPAACVFVDDLAPNIRGAEAVGMVGVLHRSYEETADRLEALFGRPLRAPAV